MGNVVEIDTSCCASDTPDAAPFMPKETPFDGKWSQAVIKAGVVTWEDGRSINLAIENARTCRMLCDGDEPKGSLDGNQLRWSNGDVWTRLDESGVRGRASTAQSFEIID